MLELKAYYNENEPFAAKWLRNLIDKGLIAPGDVDDRSIEDVQASDLDGYCQCHFFAGIGGWSYALRLAGWPDDRPVWTGSCPCQPFSTAGKHRGTDDDRHLWPEFVRLIGQCKPPTVFGEQVGGASGFKWLVAVCVDVEVLGYAFGSASLPACATGSPHERQRFFLLPTPQAMDAKGFSLALRHKFRKTGHLKHWVHGTPLAIHSPTGKSSWVKPELTAWLMGFPPRWLSARPCGVSATPSSRK